MTVTIVICRNNRAAASLGSVVRSELLPAAVFAGSLLPFWRGSRHFQFIPIVKAIGGLIPLRFNSSQEPKRRVTQGLKSFLSLLSHVRNLAWRSKHEVHRKSASGAQSSE